MQLYFLLTSLWSHQSLAIRYLSIYFLKSLDVIFRKFHLIIKMVCWESMSVRLKILAKLFSHSYNAISLIANKIRNVRSWSRPFTFLLYPYKKNAVAVTIKRKDRSFFTSVIFIYFFLSFFLSFLFFFHFYFALVTKGNLSLSHVGLTQ